MKDHGENVVRILKSLQEWPEGRHHLISPTKRSYYLDVVELDKNIHIRYRINPNISPQEVAEGVNMGSIQPIKTFSMADQMSILANINSMPRGMRRKHLRQYKKESYKNSWAYDVRVALNEEE